MSTDLLLKATRPVVHDHHIIRALWSLVASGRASYESILMKVSLSEGTILHIVKMNL